MTNKIYKFSLKHCFARAIVPEGDEIQGINSSILENLTGELTEIKEKWFAKYNSADNFVNNYINNAIETWEGIEHIHPIYKSWKEKFQLLSVDRYSINEHRSSVQVVCKVKEWNESENTTNEYVLIITTTYEIETLEIETE